MATEHDLTAQDADILVVDDETASLRLLTELLIGAGYQARPAERPLLALEAALAQPPGLILLDVRMPEMSGFEVCRRLKQDERTRDIPIIFVSALNQVQDQIEGFEVGGVDFISKPFQELETLARVKTHLQLRDMQLHLEDLVSQRTAELTRTNERLLLEIAERQRSAAALQASEERYRTLVEQAQDGIVVLQDSKIQFVNPAVEELFGYTADELLNTVFTEYITPDELPRVADMHRRRMNGEPVPSRYESAVLHKDGSRVEVEFNAGVTLYSGAPADLVMIRDITESKRTAAVIRVQKELLENTIESLAHPFYVIDVKDYTIQMTNSAARKLGATSASTCYALTHQSDTPCEGTDHTCPLIEVKETRKPVVLEHIHYDTNGKPVFFELHSYPILDVDGNVVQMIEYSLDITERKRAEQALQESEERFRATFEQAAVGIAHMAPEGGFLRLNRKFCEIVGYSPEEMLARTFQDITHPDDLDADLEQVRRLLAGEAEFYSIEKRYVRRNGEIVWVNLTVSLLWEGTGEPRYYVSVVEDITRRKLVEQQVMEYQRRLQALASQLTLAEERERHRIARELHDEVGQTLAYARMRLASARKATSDARRETILEDASQSLRQAIGDTRDLVFDLSSPLMDEVGLATALEEWLEEQVSKKHGIQTEFVHDGQRLPLDDDLRAILFRSVRELLTNVIKHAQAKRVNVRLEGEGMLVRIVVKDDGIGFDADAIPEAMERGAGFGLFSIQERMADLGGSLEVTSEPGHGCTAILTVPTTMD